MTEPLPPNLLLCNARIVVAEEVLEGGAIALEQGRIVSIADIDMGGQVDGDGQLDLEGLTVYPGFIDVHIHGAVGIDMMEASAADITRVSQFLATQGVTSWLPTRG